MPISQGAAGGLPGMNLKAWAVVTSAGAVVKSLNVASVVKGAAGVYTFTFTAAMTSTAYTVQLNPLDFTGGIAGSSSSAKTTAGVTGSATVSGSPSDMAALWVFYE